MLTGTITTGGTAEGDAGALDTTGTSDGMLSRMTGGTETLALGAADDIGASETETMSKTADEGTSGITEADDCTETADGVITTTMVLNTSLELAINDGIDITDEEAIEEAIEETTEDENLLEDGAVDD